VSVEIGGIGCVLPGGVPARPSTLDEVQLPGSTVAPLEARTLAQDAAALDAKKAWRPCQATSEAVA
jgi:hypothetical protein